MSSKEISYKDAGVDTHEGAVAVDKIKASVKRTYRPEVIGDLGGFGGLFSIARAKEMQEPVLVSGTDGVGTKLELAKRLNMHEGVGIDLVAMCANDILVSGAEPLFFLDYIAIGKLDSDFVAKVVEGIAQGCELAGCSLIGGEMAEHPGVMDPKEYDLSGFCVGLADKAHMLSSNNVSEGDIILGLSSTGIHSNGFSLVRKAFTDILSDEELLKSQESLGGKSYAEALMAPTRIYVKPVLEVLQKSDAIAALAHITGGGITENLNRALPKDLDAQVRLGSWEIPPIITTVVEAAGLSESEALKTFNMGIGLCIIVKQDKLDDLISLLDHMGEKYFEIGRIVSGVGEVHYSRD